MSLIRMSIPFPVDRPGGNIPLRRVVWEDGDSLKEGAGSFGLVTALENQYYWPDVNADTQADEQEMTCEL
jgi:PDZ domain-containing secreted protein